MADFQSLFGDNCQEFTCSYSPADACNGTKTAQGCTNSPGCSWMQADCTTCAPVCRDPTRSLYPWQLYLGFVLSNFGFTIGRLSVGTLWGIMLVTKSGSAHRAHAWMQSYYESAGNLARIFGPVICIALYTAVSNRTFVTMSVLAAMSGFVALFAILCRNLIARVDPRSRQTASSTPLVSDASDGRRPVGWTETVSLTYLVVATNFSFGVPLPSLKALVETSASNLDPPGLGETETMYSVVVALFSVGCFIGANMAGWIQTRLTSFQWTSLILNAIGVLGGVLCGISTSAVMLCFGRTFVGIWMGGMNVVFRTYVSAFVPKQSTAQFYAASAFFCALAWAVSPAVGSALALASAQELGPLRFDKFRWPGWVIAALSASCLVSQKFL